MLKPIVLIFLLNVVCCRLIAQDDPEFPAGFVLYLKAHNGVSSSFNRHPDLYAGNLQLVPEITVVPGVLRAGVVAGAVYTNKRLQGLFGTTVAVKLLTIPVSFFGSAGNIHLSLEHLWGTGRQQLAGGGLHADILNKILVGVTAHRDYHLNTWWIQQALGVRINKKHIQVLPFNQ